MSAEPNFCEDCRHYRPNMGIVSFFGLLKPTAANFAKCMHPQSKWVARGIAGVIRGAKPIPQGQYYCTSVRFMHAEDGACELFEPHEAEPPVTR